MFFYPNIVYTGYKIDHTWRLFNFDLSSPSVFQWSCFLFLKHLSSSCLFLCVFYLKPMLWKPSAVSVLINCTESLLMTAVISVIEFFLAGECTWFLSCRFLSVRVRCTEQYICREKAKQCFVSVLGDVEIKLEVIFSLFCCFRCTVNKIKRSLSGFAERK